MLYRNSTSLFSIVTKGTFSDTHLFPDPLSLCLSLWSSLAVANHFLKMDHCAVLWQSVKETYSENLETFSGLFLNV